MGCQPAFIKSKRFILGNPKWSVKDEISPVSSPISAKLYLSRGIVEGLLKKMNIEHLIKSLYGVNMAFECLQNKLALIE